MAEFLLMGGLGNQLFQLSAALETSGNEIKLITDIGTPRVSQDGLPEIASFNLPDRVIFEKRGSCSYISVKLLNLGIRIGAKANKRNIRICLLELTSIIFSKVILKNGFSIKLNAGTGYDPKFRVSYKSVNVGYFQHSISQFSSKHSTELSGITLKNPGATYKLLEEKAAYTKPTILHMRLGDYLLEDSFGIPSRSYYQEALDLLKTKSALGPIWLFSNDPQQAMKSLPAGIESKIFVVPNEDLSSAETLNLMRYGSSFVIANSTFSWWGARLAFSKNAPVIIPTPWFKVGKVPYGIYPESWIQIEARYDK